MAIVEGEDARPELLAMVRAVIEAVGLDRDARTIDFPTVMSALATVMTITIGSRAFLESDDDNKRVALIGEMIAELTDTLPAGVARHLISMQELADAFDRR